MIVKWNWNRNHVLVDLAGVRFLAMACGRGEGGRGRLLPLSGLLRRLLMCGDCCVHLQLPRSLGPAANDANAKQQQGYEGADDMECIADTDVVLHHSRSVLHADVKENFREVEIARPVGVQRKRQERVHEWRRRCQRRRRRQRTRLRACQRLE